MFLDPATLALTGLSLGVAAMVVAAAGFGWRVLRRWDLASGSALQLALERRTVLVSSLLGWVLAAQLVGLLVFVLHAEALSSRLVGAMCATGGLNGNAYGWPCLLLKIANFFLTVSWLALNRLDNQGFDYPLVRMKYAALLILAPLLVMEAGLQAGFFAALDPDVITSCCGSLFGTRSRGIGAGLAGADPAVSLFALCAVLIAVLIIGVRFLRFGRGGSVLAAGGACVFLTGVAAVISPVSVYVYEQPRHPCPFCLLKAGYHGVGYLLYVPLIVGTAFAFAAAVNARYAAVESLAAAAAADGRRFGALSLAGFLIFAGVVVYCIFASRLILFGGAG